MVRATVRSQMHGIEEHQIGLNALGIDCFGAELIILALCLSSFLSAVLSSVDGGLAVSSSAARLLTFDFF